MSRSTSKHVRFAANHQLYAPAVIPRTPSPSWSDESLPESSAPYTPPSTVPAPLPGHASLAAHALLAFDHTKASSSQLRYDLNQRPITAAARSTRGSSSQLSQAELSQPATYPPLAYMEIRVPYLPWKAVQIAASNPRVGVTVIEVLEIVYRYLRLPVSGVEYSQFPPNVQQSISMAFPQRCNAAADRETEKRKGLRRVDCLAGCTSFAGLSRAGKDSQSWQLHVSPTTR